MNLHLEPNQIIYELLIFVLSFQGENFMVKTVL